MWVGGSSSRFGRRGTFRRERERCVLAGLDQERAEWMEDGEGGAQLRTFARSANR